MTEEVPGIRLSPRHRFTTLRFHYQTYFFINLPALPAASQALFPRPLPPSHALEERDGLAADHPQKRRWELAHQDTHGTGRTIRPAGKVDLLGQSTCWLIELLDQRVTSRSSYWSF